MEHFRADSINIKRAKFYNNVTDDPMFNVPHDQVNLHPPLTSHNICISLITLNFILFLKYIVGSSSCCSYFSGALL